MKNKFEKILFSILLSSIIIYLLKEPVSSISILGSPISIRSPGYQFAFFVLLTNMLSLAIIIFFEKQVTWLIQNLPFSLGLISIVPLISYSVIGSYSRLIADDYLSASWAISKGVFKATLDWYFRWSGRFTASFFDSLIGYFGNGITPFITGIAILLWLIALISIARHFFQSALPSNRFAYSLITASLILVTTFEITPLLSQSLYWGQGMRSLILPLILATTLISIFYSQILKENPSTRFWMITVGIISFLAGGFGETYVVFQTAAYALVLFLAIFAFPKDRQKDILPIIIVGLLSSILALGITIIAPGNKARQSFFPPPPDLFNLLRISVYSFLDYFQTLGNSTYKLFVIIVFFLSSISLGYIQKNQPTLSAIRQNKNRISEIIAHSYLKTILLISSISIILIFVCFVPSAYGMSTHPSERTLVIPTFLLVITIYFFGSVTGKYFFPRMKSFVQTHFSPRFIRSSSLLFIILFSIFTVGISNKIMSELPKYRHFAEVYDIAEARIREAKAEGRESVSVRQVHNLFGLSDFGNGPTDWLHEAVNSYYGIPVTVHWVE